MVWSIFLMARLFIEINLNTWTHGNVLMHEYLYEILKYFDEAFDIFIFCVAFE